MAENDDKRAAVAFSVTLSGQLITAALAMMAAEGAFVSYGLGSRAIETRFVIAAAFAAILFISSIFVAGKGITAARNAGFKGEWSLEEGKGRFNLQALFLLLGLASLAVMFFLSGSSKQSAIESRIVNLENDVKKLLQQAAVTSIELARSQQALHDLQVQAPPASPVIPPASGKCPVKQRRSKNAA